MLAHTVQNTDRETLQGFVEDATTMDAKVYTDDAPAYRGMARDHESVNHSVGEYVRDQAHTQGIESFWSIFKRGYHGIFHHLSEKHLDRYVSEFETRHNRRPHNTIDQMARLVGNMAGKRLRYMDLITDNGLASGARS